MSRLIEFDVAKALCIILVVMGHYAVDNPSWWVTTHDIIYTFHMPLFMFASGFIYIAFKKEESYGHFLMKKVRRLMIPYITTSIIIVTLKLMSQSGLYVENPVTTLSYFKILYLPEAGSFLWFVWALWWMFCLVPFFKTQLSRSILFGGGIFLYLISPYINLPEEFCLKQAANMLIWFMFGVMCYDWKIQIRKVNFAQIVLLLFVFVSLIIIGGTGGKHPDGLGQVNQILTDSYFMRLLFRIMRPCLGIMLIMCLSKWLSQHKVPILLKIAASSYIIYLFHTTFTGFTRAILVKIPYMQTMTVLTIFIVVTTGVICPMLLHRLLMKYRISRFFF